MNILFITHLSELHGSIRSLLDLTDGLQKYGVRPFFVIPAEGNYLEPDQRFGTAFLDALREFTHSENDDRLGI